MFLCIFITRNQNTPKSPASFIGLKIFTPHPLTNPFILNLGGHLLSGKEMVKFYGKTGRAGQWSMGAICTLNIYASHHNYIGEYITEELRVAHKCTWPRTCVPVIHNSAGTLRRVALFGIGKVTLPEIVAAL